jgi:hypothetical protein
MLTSLEKLQIQQITIRSKMEWIVRYTYRNWYLPPGHNYPGRRSFAKVCFCRIRDMLGAVEGDTDGLIDSIYEEECSNTAKMRTAPKLNKAERGVTHYGRGNNETI